MARIELTAYERILVDLAQETLAEAKRAGMSDRGEMARMLGRLEHAAESLLAILNPPSSDHTANQEGPT